ncbi:MAG TPA: nucleotidyl transferase AbiEii/AbiGii toxin family protein [Kofleriaceae bacterium]|jgi:hypothetical protein
MTPLDAARRIAAVLSDDGVRYALGGALALGVWGLPRATKDVDISIFVRRDELPRVLDLLEHAGVMVHHEDARRGVERNGLFNGRCGTITIDVFLSEHPQYADMARRARSVVDSTGQTLWFISAEDLCLHKLIFGRPKDVIDLEGMLAVRPIDFDYVADWLDKMTPEGDPRRAVLVDLRKRFGTTP